MGITHFELLRMLSDLFDEAEPVGWFELTLEEQESLIYSYNQK